LRAGDPKVAPITAPSRHLPVTESVALTRPWFAHRASRLLVGRNQKVRNESGRRYWTRFRTRRSETLLACVCKRTSSWPQTLGRYSERKRSSANVL